MARPPQRGARPVSEVLAELTYWRKLDAPNDDPDERVRKSTGEAPARIADLEDQLRTRGIAYHWDGERYVLGHPESS